jgi:hypothetical protein
MIPVFSSISPCIQCKYIDTDASGSIITVSAGGKVSSAVPQVYWNGNQVSYPAYSYTDEIGETGIRLKVS